jgi:K+/H+ antiporter YhaU regulatory subunit KhtT
MSYLFHYTAAAAFIITFCGCVKVETESQKLPDAINLPAIQKANITKTKLQRDVLEAKEIGNELETITTDISRQRITLQSSSTDTAIKNLIESTQRLRESAKAILEKGPRYVEKLDSFDNDIGDAPTTFKNAAKVFRAFAEEETYADLAKDYRQVALLFENLAARTKTDSSTFRVRYNREAILETLRYICHQERFLDRLEAALRSQDFDLRELESFLDEITNYAKKFEQLRIQIQDLNTALHKIEEQPTPSNPQPTKSPKPATPAKASKDTVAQVIPTAYRAPPTPTQKQPKEAPVQKIKETDRSDFIAPFSIDTGNQVSLDTGNHYLPARP